MGGATVDSRPDTPLVGSVLHPSDFSDASHSAFAHALALALLRGTRLTILHSGAAPRSSRTWDSFPSVRATLERWGLLERGSPRSAVFEELAVQVKKVAVRDRRPVSGILNYLEDREIDLLVLATRGRKGPPRWLKPSVSERLARRSKRLMLFVPRGARGFVSAENGSFVLRRILVPVAHRPDPRAAMEMAARAARVLGNGAAEVTLLHVGSRRRMPVTRTPDDLSCAWVVATAKGKVVDEILATADRMPADLVVMVTAGREGLVENLRGGTTEQVLRRARCPLLTVPEDWVDRLAFEAEVGLGRDPASRT